MQTKITSSVGLKETNSIWQGQVRVGIFKNKENPRFRSHFSSAPVVELVDTYVWGAYVERRRGSSPRGRTTSVSFFGGQANLGLKKKI